MKNLTHQHYTQSRLHAELTGKPISMMDTSGAVGSGSGTGFDVPFADSEFGATLGLSEDKSSSLATTANLIATAPTTTAITTVINDLDEDDDDDDDDEEVDEYVDDEDDVDDSTGDESAMLKHAHASAQAYCRRSTNSGTASDSAGGGDNAEHVSNNNVNVTKETTLSSTAVESVTTPDKTRIPLSTVELKLATDAVDDSSAETMKHPDPSCSPPSILAFVSQLKLSWCFMDYDTDGTPSVRRGSSVRNLRGKCLITRSRCDNRVFRVYPHRYHRTNLTADADC